MTAENNPIPKNEFERLISLANFDLDYSSLNENFKDLTELAAKVTGSEISLVNLVDQYTQWSISDFGISDLKQMPREDSTCQYTIMGGEYFEVQNFSLDERLKNKPYVSSPLNLRYYFGIPLTTKEGHNIGALCVLDRIPKKMSPEKIELLKLIGNEVINRLNMMKVVLELKTRISDSKENNMKIAHDIRGPLSGIIGIAEIIGERGDQNKLNEILDLITMIQKSSKSLLTLADEILTNDYQQSTELSANDFNLLVLQEKLDILYRPQARNKNINFKVNIGDSYDEIPFAKNKLLQIAGNLVSNAIKFTPIEGNVTVNLSLDLKIEGKVLCIIVSDSGPGLDEESIHNILFGEKSSTGGSNGEQGYGFGLVMVKHLIDSMNGKLEIKSDPTHNTQFKVLLPIG
ncbi:sensor histidine kinase [Pedobacter changchengzhani]|uniref:histidine kinase n=1 Tax=Pedobacter changchengzhani TaxID=2529274 RepID=A0A4R5MK94_9SPHI|nr:GAF domain-containing sensor histidine kinase [Pedobacter changchengzhani]TDG36127.1 sensor histidine kinase [Pedobacter changchengzhani]